MGKGCAKDSWVATVRLGSWPDNGSMASGMLVSEGIDCSLWRWSDTPRRTGGETETAPLPKPSDEKSQLSVIIQSSPHVPGVRARCNHALTSLLVQCLKAPMARSCLRVKHACSERGWRLRFAGSDRASMSHANMSPSCSSFRMAIALRCCSSVGAEAV